jgi:hypothetical protein
MYKCAFRCSALDVSFLFVIYVLQREFEMSTLKQ